jgi:hypothetical protein
LFKKICLIFIISSTLVAQHSKSPLAKSLIIPGWGQLEEGNVKSAKQFFIQESVLILSFLGTIWTSNHYEKSYIAFANEYAGINLSDMSLQMAVDVGNYSSLSDFNENKERQRQFNIVLDENNPDFFWEWKNNEDRDTFDKMRITSSLSSKVGSFIIGGIISHHIISAIHVKYLQNKKIPQLGFNIQPKGDKSVSLIWNF